MNFSGSSGKKLYTPMALAWLEASADLGFEFISPYTFVDDAGEPHTCSGLLRYFGGPKGTLIVSRDDEDPDADEAGAPLGYFTSALNPRYYEVYDRAVFLETLIDWGWYGPAAQRPAWLR